MSIQIIAAGATFNPANVVRKTSLNSVRAGLNFEHVLGGNATLSAKNLVSAGIDSSVLGVPTFTDNYMSSSGANKILTAYPSVGDEVWVMVTERLSGTNYAMGSFNAANYRSLSVSLDQIIVQGGGGNRITQSVAALALGVPYFFAVRFIQATGTYKAFWGKAGALNSVSATGGAIPAVINTQNILVGSDLTTASTAVRKMWYAAAYNINVVDADIAQIYSDLRNWFGAQNADF